MRARGERVRHRRHQRLLLEQLACWAPSAPRLPANLEIRPLLSGVSEQGQKNVAVKASLVHLEGTRPK